MSSYDYPGSLDNPGNLDLSVLESEHRPFKKALAIGMPFIERVGFANSPMIGVWFATNAKPNGDSCFDDLFRHIRQMINKLLDSYGVPSEATLNSRPTWSNGYRTITVLDMNPCSKTQHNRKRQQLHKAFWNIRDAASVPTVQPADETEGHGGWFFEWTRIPEGIFPREGEMPIENLHSPMRFPYGHRYGRIRNDLLSPV